MLLPREWSLALSPHHQESYRGTRKEWMNFNSSPRPTRQAAAPTTATHCSHYCTLLCPPGRLALVLPVHRRGPSIQHPPGAPVFTQ